MKLVDYNVEYLPQNEGLIGIYKQIERCGRICYKSEDKITDDSAMIFVNRLINAKHYAMLEHGTVYLKIPFSSYITVGKYLENPYSEVVEGDCYYVTTNYRVIVENGWQEDIQDYLCNPESQHVRRYTFKFIGDIGVKRELLRHRTMSFAQESTRYCNYKGEVTFVIPSWSNELNDTFINALSFAENSYIRLISEGWKPQQARAVLPLATKTETCVTGFAYDWRYILDLRLFGKTGAPHPDMLYMMEKFKETAKEAGIWNDIMTYNSKFE